MTTRIVEGCFHCFLTFIHNQKKKKKRTMIEEIYIYIFFCVLFPKFLFFSHLFSVPTVSRTHFP